MQDGPCVIELPKDTLVYFAKALKYGTIVLKVVLASQGFGGTVPDLSLLVSPILGLDTKAFLDEYESKVKEAEAAANAAAVAGGGGATTADILTDIVDAAAAGADTKVEQLRKEFKTIFDNDAESDGTTSMLAIYGLIAKAKGGIPLEQALRDGWQPRDKMKRPWGMELVQPKGSNQWVWASEVGAQRLREVGLTALNPSADINRDAVKTGMTLTERATGLFAKTWTRIDVDGIKKRCEEQYGIHASAVAAVLDSPTFVEVLMALAEGNDQSAQEVAQATWQGEGAQHAALLKVVLSGGTDWSGMDALLPAAVAVAGTFAADALWVTAKKAPALHVEAIERGAQRLGLRDSDVKDIFLAAVEESAVETAMRAVINGDEGGAVDVALGAVVQRVSSRTGMLPMKTQAVLAALLTGDVGMLEAMADDAAPGVLWTAAKKMPSMQIDVVERGAVRLGLRDGDVEKIFAAAVGERDVHSAVRARLAGDLNGADNVALDAVVDNWCVLG